jgi:hypothetical protein
MHPVVATKPPLPHPELKQENPELKKGQILKYADANYSQVTLRTQLEIFKNTKPMMHFQEESRAYDPKYFFASSQAQHESSTQEESRGRKRARAEDFL